ncbi:MAG TPA: rhodanese-like domain-containing protein [Micavibrio sp.]
MQATNEVPHISPEEALERQQNGTAVLVDVREPDELAVVAIAGAVNVPVSSFDPQAVLDAAGDKDIVFFCKIGGRAANVWQYFTQKTGRDAVCMTGSITAWAAKGLPVQS